MFIFYLLGDPSLLLRLFSRDWPSVDDMQKVLLLFLTHYLFERGTTTEVSLQCVPQFKELLIGNTLGNNRRGFDEVYLSATRSTEINLADVLSDGLNV